MGTRVSSLLQTAWTSFVYQGHPSSLCCSSCPSPCSLPGLISDWQTSSWVQQGWSVLGFSLLMVCPWLFSTFTASRGWDRRHGRLESIRREVRSEQGLLPSHAS